MKRALVLFAVLQPLFTPPAFGGVPELNIKAVCKARSADAEMLQSPPDESTADCVLIAASRNLIHRRANSEF